MAKLGRSQFLTVARLVSIGAFVDAEELGHILVPQKYLPKDTAIGDELEIFIYLDSEERYIGTTETPYAQEGEFAYLRVNAVNDLGAFLDWGLSRDLFVPFKEQRVPMEEGESYLIRVYVDERTDRLTGTSRLHRFLQPHGKWLQEGSEVQLIIWEETDLGYRVIINDEYEGLLHRADALKKFEQVEFMDGYIKKIRPDGKVDVCLQKPGNEKFSELEEDILEYLRLEGGVMKITDKSAPEVIFEEFQVSKKAFKRAIGGLYKLRKIQIEGDSIRLL